MNFNFDNVAEGYCVVIGTQEGISKTGNPYRMYHVANNNLKGDKVQGYSVETIFDNCTKDFGIKIGDICSFLYKMNGNFKQGIGHVEIVGNVFKSGK